MVAVAAHCEGLLYGSGSMSAGAPEDATFAFGMLFRFIGSFQKFDIETPFWGGPNIMACWGLNRVPFFWLETPVYLPYIKLTADAGQPK